MKTKTLLLLSGIFIMFALSLQSFQQDKPAATICCNNPAHDFGEVIAGKMVNHTFVLKSCGNFPLLISQVKASCGSTGRSFSKAPTFPGDSTEIKVGFKGNKLGPFNKKIRVNSNATNSPLILIIKGTVVDE